MQTGRQVLLDAFDRLFAKAADKLKVAFSVEELSEAKRRFEERFATVLHAVGSIEVEAMPPEVLAEMEQAIENLSPVQIVGHLAAIPLAHQAQEMLRLVAYRAAEQRLLDQVMRQTDERYGGN